MGIFDDAGIDVNEIPSDPFGFGRDYWPVEIISATKPDVSKGGKQYGSMIRYKCLAPQYDYMEGLGYGNWLQLPPPKHVVDTIPSLEFDKNSERGKKCIYAIGSLFKGLGIPADKWNSIDIPDLVGMRCMAKIFVRQNEETGFWEFSVRAHKPMPEEGSEEAMDVFAKKGESGSAASSSGMSAIEKAMQDEMAANKGK